MLLFSVSLNAIPYMSTTLRGRIAIAALPLLLAAACTSTPSPSTQASAAPDPRVGLKAGKTDAAQALGNLKSLSSVATPPGGFEQTMNSDLAFTGNYAVQGNFHGPVIWDMTDPARPQLVKAIDCPASQNDVSVYRNLLFVSVESNNSTLDCKEAPTPPLDTVDARRFRGVRIFDISDIRNPRLIQNVQTCRGSHTHTVLEDPRDRDNIYVYVSGSAGPRSPRELPGCTRAHPDSASETALWRVEIIKVPLANPAAASVAGRADIFSGLKANPAHGETPVDIAQQKRVVDSARATGAFIGTFPNGTEFVLGRVFVQTQLDSIVKARGGSGAPTGADSAKLRADMQLVMNRIFGPPPAPTARPVPGVSPISTFRQCHDITVYPSLGIAGGACEGHGILLDIRDPMNPKRLDAVADSNFAYWHSATFNNDGSTILFSDEWGGGGAPKCRATDPKEWGANAIFKIVNGKMVFQSYYKLPAAQTALENCVAHNGSLIPIPGRDVMIQAWYQGGVSVFDFSDPAKPFEIAYQDRGPLDSTRFTMGGSWSAYWYNGKMVSSEIARGLDAFELTPSEFVTQNEIDAAKTVRLTYFNAQGQPKFSWPPSFPLVKAYLDQLERKKCLSSRRVGDIRGSIAAAEAAPRTQQQALLTTLASQLEGDKRSSCDAPRVNKMQQAITDLSRQLVP